MHKFSDFIVYADESGDANWKAASAYPLLCVNFCLFAKTEYLNNLLPKFNAIKFKYWGSDNIVLHESDIRKSNKISDSAIRSKYTALNGERRNRFMEDLSDFLVKANFFIFATVIDKNKVPEKYKEYSPYDIALDQGFQQIHNFLKDNAPEQLGKELHFVIEKRGHQDDTSLSNGFKRILDHGSIYGKVPINHFSSFRLELMDKKAILRDYKFSDLTARPIGNHYLREYLQRTQTDQRVFRIVERKLRYFNNEQWYVGMVNKVHETLKRQEASRRSPLNPDS